jgi:hypothetical protein
VTAWSGDVRAAEWIIGRLHPFGEDVGAIVPAGFEAYARILHPASRMRHGRRVKIRWRDVAGATGRPFTATAPFDELAADAPDIDPPAEGTLDCDELTALLESLRPATAEPATCWFGIWEGYGWIQGPPAVSELSPGLRGVDRLPLVLPPPVTARVPVPERPLVLYQGPVNAATAFCSEPLAQSPTLWWPADRAWCVASEIDFHSTYLGGSRQLIADVLADCRLEAVRTDIRAPVTD